MRDSVKRAFYGYSVRNEGFTPFMYADSLNLVTTGVGNLIDSGPRNGMDTSESAMAPALELPWRRRAPGWTRNNPLAGEKVQLNEVRDAWVRVKTHPMNGKQGGFAYENVTDLTLDAFDMQALFNGKLMSNEAEVRSRFPDWEAWPADAQFATMSMVWGMGAGALDGFPRWSEAVRRRDWNTAAEESFFRGGGGTKEARSGRNLDNQIMFLNADRVEKGVGDPNVLYFEVPGGLPTPPPPSAPLAYGPRYQADMRPLLVIFAIGAIAWGGYALWSGRMPAFR